MAAWRQRVRARTQREVQGRNPMMNGHGKSHSPIVPTKPPNKAGEPAAEGVEGRGLAKGNSREQNALRTQGRVSAQSALERVREASDPRQEPYEGKPHVRICAGGTGRPVSLPRRMTISMEFRLFTSSSKLWVKISGARPVPPEILPTIAQYTTAENMNIVCPPEPPMHPRLL